MSGSDVDNGVVDDDTDNHVYGSECRYSPELSPTMTPTNLSSG